MSTINGSVSVKCLDNSSDDNKIKRSLLGEDLYAVVDFMHNKKSNNRQVGRVMAHHPYEERLSKLE